MASPTGDFDVIAADTIRLFVVLVRPESSGNEEALRRDIQRAGVDIRDGAVCDVGMVPANRTKYHHFWFRRRDFHAGRRLGPFTLEQELGRGTYGVVWRATYRTALLNRVVAVKFPFQSHIDPTMLRREAAAWVHASNHPNVSGFIFADEIDGHLVMVSEYAPGHSLQEWVETHDHHPSLADALRMTLGVLAGVGHIHSRGVIHRDLKPANVLLDEEGRPLIADFGFARVVLRDDPSGVLRGSPAYMAPEVWGQAEPAREADLWAVGVMLYQLVCGRRPFVGDTWQAVMSAILTEPHPPLPTAVPTRVRRVVERALQKNPADRYHSAEEMVAALTAATTGAVTRRRALRALAVTAAVSLAAGCLLGVFGFGCLFRNATPANTQSTSTAAGSGGSDVAGDTPATPPTPHTGTPPPTAAEKPPPSAPLPDAAKYATRCEVIGPRGVRFSGSGTVVLVVTHFGRQANLTCTAEHRWVVTTAENATPRAFLVHALDGPAENVGHGFGFRVADPHELLVNDKPKEDYLSRQFAAMQQVRVRFPQQVRVACVGDSITRGADGAAYPAALGERLGEAFEVRNFGIDGATASADGAKPYAAQSALDDALGFRPEVVVVLLGTNDSKPGDWRGKDAFTTGLAALLAKFEQLEPSPKIFVCTPPPVSGDTWGIRAKVLEDEIRPAVQEASKGAEVIDLHQAFAGNGKLLSDGVHPNPDGCRLIAGTVAEAFNRPPK